MSIGANEWGIGTDALGNVYFMDNNSSNAIIHKIDARSGIMTLVAGGATASGCTGQVTIYGDGCSATTQVKSLNPRNMGIDPYGNIIIPDYGKSLVHIVCNTVSPLCTSAQIGTMQLLAGYISSSSSTGVVGITAGTAGDGTLAVSPVNTTGVNGDRGATADIYGNVYIADTQNERYRVVLGPASYNGVTNPLVNVIKSDPVYTSPTVGYIYPIMGGFITTQPTVGAFCNGSSGATVLDKFGDGCPFYNTYYPASNSTLYGVTTDAAGDVLFADTSDKLIRVLYMGGSQMAALITLENPTITSPVVGFVYAIAGGGNTGVSTTAVLGTTLILNGPNSVTVDPNGNIYAGETSKNDVLFIDAKTGYGRVLFATGSACTAKTNAIGDGCPAGQAPFGGGSYTVPIAFDPLGNLYLADQTNSRIRKISATSLLPMTVGTAASQSLLVHEPAGVTGVSAALTNQSPDIVLGTPSCAAANGDGTRECTIVATLTASSPGVRSAKLVVTPAGSVTTPSLFTMAGLATGSALATDNAVATPSGGSPASVIFTATLGSYKSAAIAADGGNNLYFVDSASSSFGSYIPGTGAALLSSTAYASPTTISAPAGLKQIAVDQQGSIYAVGTGSTITKLTATGTGAPPVYSTSNITYTPPTAPALPQGIAVDGIGNIYVADGTNKAVYKFNPAATTQPIVTVAGGLSNPTLLALDNGGNLYVYDAGATTVYKYNLAGTQSTVVSGVTATGLATDAALNLYVQTATGVTEYPASGATTTVYSGGTTPTGIALDGSGNLYDADSSTTGILQVQRAAVSYNFGTGSATPPTLTGTLTNVGNQAVTGSNTVTNTTNFAVTGTGGNACPFSSNILGAQAVGNACNFSATFVGSGSGTVTDAITYLPSSTVGSLTLTGTLVGTAVATTTTISNQTPTNPNYSTGTEVSFLIQVSPASGTTAPAGTVAITLDSGTANAVTVNPSLTANGTNGQYTYTLSGIAAGTHTVYASYATSGAFTASNSGTPFSFTIAPNTPTVSWTPGTLTGSYSAPVGTAVLNATASYGGNAIPGVYVYTANGTEIHAASYLARGSYTLGVTFYPTDSTDYLTNTAAGGTFTVNQASTSAPIGGTQMLVAADGTGNYTSVQAAVNALNATSSSAISLSNPQGYIGGSVYIKPGTYTGNITVAQPNVALRGLGGDPTQVILTHSGGAFNNGQAVNQYAGEFNSSQNNGYQLPAGSALLNGDEGSATLVVARTNNYAISGSTTTTPNAFYGENFTLRNTYNTDTSTMTNTYVSGGACNANTSQPAQSYSALFNAGIQCASQALAIWITSDTAVMNNVYTASLQDTIYAGAISAGSAPSRQYWFRGQVIGNVDYIFGDAAAVFDHTSIYSAWHSTATGSVTIEAQNKSSLTGGSSDYLSGYVMNSDIFTSQSTGMTGLDFGRPYGTYSTYIMLNSLIDQVASVGYNSSLGVPLTNTTYGEYNDTPYTDPTPGSADANGVIYPATATGGNTGQGVLPTSAREAGISASLQTSDPGYAAFNANTTNAIGMTQPQAQQFYPLAFLGKTVPITSSNQSYIAVTNWDPTAAIAAKVNAFVPSTSPSSINYGQPITILMRPRTPGLGAVNNGVYTLPTGTYTLSDNGTQIASGSLDASGEAYFTTAALNAGAHSFTWTYSGDSNFAGSATATAYALTVVGLTPSVTLSSTTNPSTYGQTASVTVAVSGAGATPTGSVSVSVDGVVTSGSPFTLSSGSVTVSLPGLSAGSHAITASYTGNTVYASGSSASAYTLTVQKATLNIAGTCTNRAFYTANNCTVSIGSYQNGDTTGTVFSMAPVATTSAIQSSPAGNYPTSAAYTLTTAGSTNYTVVNTPGSFTITGGGNAAQNVIFAPLPSLPAGTYQLTARTTSGLPVTYTVTGGGASISGSTLTLSGATGNVIQITATATDPKGDYATATAVRSFTAK
jgi:sugar lactone lactonase YvrE